jgi:hypothetical protein
MDPALPFPRAPRVIGPKRHNPLPFNRLPTNPAIFEIQQRIFLSLRIGSEKSRKVMAEAGESTGETLYLVFIQKYKDHTRLFSWQDHIFSPKCSFEQPKDREKPPGRIEAAGRKPRTEKAPGLPKRVILHGWAGVLPANTTFGTANAPGSREAVADLSTIPPATVSRPRR